MLVMRPPYVHKMKSCFFADFKDSEKVCLQIFFGEKRTGSRNGVRELRGFRLLRTEETDFHNEYSPETPFVFVNNQYNS
jgi:hypothetical protein